MKCPLHPALAVVQTPSREYFILRENGMQIGCEEEGIAEIWMEIIGCGLLGRIKIDFDVMMIKRTLGLYISYILALTYNTHS